MNCIRHHLAVRDVTGTLNTTKGPVSFGLPTDVVIDGSVLTFTFARRAAGCAGVMETFDLRLGDLTLRRPVTPTTLDPSSDITIEQRLQLDATS